MAAMRSWCATRGGKAVLIFEHVLDKMMRHSYMHCGSCAASSAGCCAVQAGKRGLRYLKYPALICRAGGQICVCGEQPRAVFVRLGGPCEVGYFKLLRCPAAQVGKFAFVANSRARSVSDTEGLVKFVSDAQTDKILGVHIMGPNAGELISECVLVRPAAPWLNT